jgi:WD40 repeat protein
MRRLLKEGLLQEAAQLLEDYVSKHSLDLDEFAMLFAGEQEKESLEVEHLFEDFLQESKELPETRADFHCFHSQVWFVIAVQDRIFAVDDKSNARVLETSVVVAEKSKLHAGKTIYVTSNGSTMIATAGEDRALRVWDKDINLVYESKVHANKIASLEFIPNTDCLMSCDSGGTLVVHHIFRRELPLRLIKTRPLVDIKYIGGKSKGRIVGLASEAG